METTDLATGMNTRHLSPSTERALVDAVVETVEHGPSLPLCGVVGVVSIVSIVILLYRIARIAAG